MATTKSTKVMTEQEELLSLENRKVKALEKIANTMDALTVWFEEIEKDEWSDRIQYYLTEFHNIAKPKDPTING
jgi:uncharacterized LabA/DUF88 family protein